MPVMTGMRIVNATRGTTPRRGRDLLRTIVRQRKRGGM
jgi:hypothetical protein